MFVKISDFLRQSSAVQLGLMAVLKKMKGNNIQWVFFQKSQKILRGSQTGLKIKKKQVQPVWRR